MKVQILGIDLAKNVFQLHGVDRKGSSVLVRRVRREQLLRVVADKRDRHICRRRADSIW